jgi:hypothetical protein
MNEILASLQAADEKDRLDSETKVLLFRGIRNEVSSREQGLWWTEDAFYAYECASNEQVFVGIMKREDFYEGIRHGKIQDETYHKNNATDSEILFIENPSFIARPLSYQEISLLKGYLRVRPFGSTKFVKRLFSESGVTLTKTVFSYLV